MNIDPQIKKQLDMRLANGEICIEEYKSTIETLGKTADLTKQQPKEGYPNNTSHTHKYLPEKQKQSNINHSDEDHNSEDDLSHEKDNHYIIDIVLAIIILTGIGVLCYLNFVP